MKFREQFPERIPNSKRNCYIPLNICDSLKLKVQREKHKLDELKQSKYGTME